MKNVFCCFILMVLFMSCHKDKDQVDPKKTEPAKEIINTLLTGNNCIRFERSLKGYMTEELKAVKQTKDGGYILCGATETIAKNEYDILIVKTNCFGETEWMKTVSNAYSDFGYDILPLPSGNYFVVANVSNDPNYWKMISHQGQFILLDSIGNEVSRRDCKIGNSTRLNKVIETADGSLLISGSDDDGNFILKTNIFGPQFWIKRMALSAISKHDKNYIACGTTKISNKGAIYLVEMTTAGDTLWTKSFDKNIDAGASFITTLSNNEVIIGGTYRTSNTTFASFIMRLDANGKEIWYKSLESEGIQSLVNIVTTVDNNIVTVGRRPTGGFNIIKSNFDTGSIIWNVSKPSNSSVDDFQLTADGGFIVVGEILGNASNGDAYIIKTDKDGN